MRYLSLFFASLVISYQALLQVKLLAVGHLDRLDAHALCKTVQHLARCFMEIA